MGVSKYLRFLSVFLKAAHVLKQLNLPPVQNSCSAVWGIKDNPHGHCSSEQHWGSGGWAGGSLAVPTRAVTASVEGNCLWVTAKAQGRGEPGSCCCGAQSTPQSPWGQLPCRKGCSGEFWPAALTVLHECHLLHVLCPSLSAWMQRLLWAWAPLDAVCSVPPLSSLVFCLFQGSTVLNYWIFGYYMPEDDWQLKSELVLDAV